MDPKEEQEELAVDFFEQEVEDGDEGPTDIEDEEEEGKFKDKNKSKDDEEDIESDEDSDVDEDEDKPKGEEDEDIDDSDEDSEEDEQPESLVEEIKQNLGYDVEGEFEDTEEGIQLLVEKVSEKRSEELVDQFFNQYPDVQEYVEYRTLGGDPDKYFETKFPEVDYSEVELDSDDDAQQEQIIRRELIEVRGYAQDEVEAELEDYRNGGILESKAKRALSSLKAKQQENKESLLEEQREQAKQQEQQVKKHWEAVENQIQDSVSFKGVKIPTKDKDSFLEYLRKPVEGNKSKAMIDHQEADLETKLAIDYLLFKGFDIAGLVDRKAKDKNAKTLRQRMRKAELDKKSEESEDGDSALLEELGEI